MKFIRPLSVAAALRAFARNPKAIPMAGGTDFMVGWNAGLLNGHTVLDLSALTRWSKIRASKNRILLGALTTHTQIQQHAALSRNFPLLTQACATVGGEQIQNRGTLGGNIANASPAGDTFPPLAVYEPLVHVVSAKGSRAIPFSEVFAGVKKTTLGPAELIESVELPVLKKRATRSLFRKVGTRAAQAISKTVAAGLLWLRQGKVDEIRFALGSVAPTVKRAQSVERYLNGRKLTREAVATACELLQKDISPIDDIRSTREYRRQVSANMLRAFLSG